MKSWWIFRGDGQSSDPGSTLPPPPPGRNFSFSRGEQQQINSYPHSQAEIEQANIALYLRRPLLILSKPGYNATTLAYSVANELKLGSVLYWPISSNTNLRDGLYMYDSVSREQDMKLALQLARKQYDDNEDIGNYIRLGALGTALLPSDRPRVLLIDGIDRNINDLSLDLAHIIERGEFMIPELVRYQHKCQLINVYTFESEQTKIENGTVRCTSFPFICIVSYGATELPEELTNQCVGLEIQHPNKEQLMRIIQSLFKHDNYDPDIKSIIDELLAQSKDSQYTTETILDTLWMALATAQPISEIVNKLKRLKNSVNRDLGNEIKTSQYRAEKMYFGGFVQKMEVNMGEQINISNVSDSIINVDSILEKTSQNISNMSRCDSKYKDELKQLVDELKNILISVPDENKSEAQKMANRLDTAIKEVGKDNPDEELVEFSLDSLKKAAANIAALVPSILPIATQIVDHIRKLI